MSGNDSPLDPLSLVELNSFRLPLVAAVASKLGVFTFEPMAEEDLREAIKLKDAASLAFMDDYFQKFLVCGRSCTAENVQARDAARIMLVARTLHVAAGL